MGGVEGTGKITVHLHDYMFEPSYLFTHTSRVLLDMEERAQRAMWEFQGKRISSELSGDGDVSLCSNIKNDTDKGIHVDGVDNPSLYDAENRRQDTQVFLTFMPYTILTQTGVGPNHNNLFL